MIDEIMKNLMKATTADEILSYQPQILILYNSMYEKLHNQAYSITNFDDIKMLHDLEFPMMAYYGPCFYEKCGIPFLKEHNSGTLDIIEFSVLFYSLQIMELLEKGFYGQTSLCVYKKESDVVLGVFDHTEKINIAEYKYKHNLFAVLWYYFMCVITIEKNEREFTLEYDCDTDVFYLPDEKYEEVLDMIYKNYNASNYSCIIRKILGRYRIRFTKMTYLLEYQPLIVKVGYEYLCSIV